MSDSAARTSVIVVSRHRPDALARLLTALGQLDHPDFEVIVVADPAGIAVCAGRPVKTVAFDAANISAARNAGLAQAAAPVVAFIDDDAVPEPTWLTRLSAPFADPRVVAAGGFVRGRNGISFQWKASWTDVWGYHHPLEVDEAAPSLHTPGARVVRTEGTNSAFRREGLLRLGGFDPAFRFYLDETDLNMRLAAEGGLTAIVPEAQVHHGFAASARRSVDRAPTDLSEIGASSMLFWRKYAPGGPDFTEARARLLAAQRARLLGYMVGGGLEPQEIAGLLRSLEAGLAEGAARPLTALAPIAPWAPRSCPSPRGPAPAARSRAASGRPGASAPPPPAPPPAARSSRSCFSGPRCAATGSGSTRMAIGSRTAGSGAGPNARSRDSSRSPSPPAWRANAPASRDFGARRGERVHSVRIVCANGHLIGTNLR